jgi:hypothetical protein
MLNERPASESHRHPDVAARKSEPFIKPLRIDARAVRQQLDQSAIAGARFTDGPLHQLFADAAAAAWRGDPNVLDQAARGALRTEAGQDAELQASDDGGNGSSSRSRAAPSRSSASIATMPATSSRRARRIVIDEVAAIISP